MADHKTYEESKKAVVKGLILLGVVTLIEVFISLLGKGHIIEGLEKYNAVIYIAGLLIIALSVYKAYFIIYEFMHMAFEARSLAMTVLLPTTLLIWAVIAFFMEGNYWKERRQQIINFNDETEQLDPLPLDGKEGSSMETGDIYVPVREDQDN